MTQGTAQSWQLVMMIWGDKYGSTDINRLAAAARALSPSLRRVVLVTDRPHPGLLPGIELRDWPAGWLAPEMTRSGCQAKLAVFERGLIPADMPAVFSDLDTVFLRDPAPLTGLLSSPQTVALFQSALVPIGPLGRLVCRLSKGRKYARGNSSLVVFQPGECSYIAEKFQKLRQEHPDLGFRPMHADERFISWAAQPVLRRIPNHMAVKLPTEFMLPWLWASRARAALPWVRRRRAKLLAITLPGDAVKAERLAEAPEGSVIADHKGRQMIWSDAALGPVRGLILKALGADGAAGSR